MITIGYSTRKHNPEYQKYIQNTCMYKEVQVIEKINNGEKCLSKVYNEILEESIHDIVVLCHDDLEFDTKNWGDKLLKSFEKNPEYGILGLAGTKYLDNSAQWWKIPQTMYGIVNHKHEGKKWTSTYSPNIDNKIEETIIVDGLFIAINKQKIKHKFDESINGFHFYDLGFCLPNYLDGVKIGVTFNNRVTHLSIGQTNNQWEENRINFSKKYQKSLPIDITKTEENVETFIFVHDQNLILEFENNNRYKNLKNYKYVFLGKSLISEIEKNDKVIIARNYEKNLEDYPSLTAFTGWYLLWKNNLITKNYVNLFEYDAILNENFEQIESKIIYEKPDVIGYVPVSASNYHYIDNKMWVEHIFEAVKKVYKIDLEKQLRRLITIKPNLIWSSTNNVTFKKVIFEEFMKWFEPLIDFIKETKTAGHAQERAISFFYLTKNKKTLLTNGLIEHLQMDSHKTQGHIVDYEQSIKKLNKTQNSNSQKKNAIVALCRGYKNLNGYDFLIQRNLHIERNIISKMKNIFDIIIYHEGNITIEHQNYISSKTPNINLKFINVKLHEPRSAFDDKLNKVNMDLCPPTEESKKFPLGYKHMCHFWSIDFLKYMKNYDYIVRIDEDCVVTSFDENILKNMSENEIRFISPYFQGQDENYVIVGLEKLWNEFIFENKIKPFKNFEEIKCPYTNFMVVDVKFFNNNEIINKILNKIDKSHGIYSNRWGDLPIWGMILSTLIDDKYYTETKKISYFHGSHNKMINIEN